MEQKVFYEVMVIAMDDACDNSVDVITVCQCSTKTEALREATKTEKKLKAGKYNYCLKSINYAYVNVIPYDEYGDCLLGLAWDYASKYYQRVGEKWQ